MAIQRRLPKSNETTERALTSAKAKNDSLKSGEKFLTTPTETRLNIIQPAYHNAMKARDNALALQAGSTSLVNKAAATARLFVNHFIQVFNLGVARGKYAKADRAYYELDVNSESVPPLGKEQDITTWGTRIVEGDADRVTAGGADMVNPTAEEVGTAVDDFNDKNSDQSTKKDAYDAAQEAIIALNDEAQKVVRKVWDEIDTYYNEEEPSSKRRKAREWGVVYVSDIMLTFNFTVTDSINHLPLADVLVELPDTGTSATSDGLGKAQLKSTITDEATFRFSHPNCITKEQTITLTAGQLVFDIAVELVSEGTINPN
jgi:hypothetical protein